MVTAGFLGHALHYAIVATGLVGLAVLLVPQAVARRTSVPVAEPADLHEVRVALLREQFLPRPVLAPARPRTAPAAHAGDPLVLPVVVTASAAAAGVHAAAWPAHAHLPLPVPAFFAACALAQAVWAVLALRGPSHRLLVAAAAGNAAVVVTWLASRSVGLPGLGVEAVGPWDAVATACELVVVAGCLVLAARTDRPPRPVAPWAAWRAPARWWLAGCVLALVLLPLAGGTS